MLRVTNTQTLKIEASENLTVIIDGFDSDNSQIGLGDHNADPRTAAHMTVTRDFYLEVTPLADGGFDTALVGKHGVSMTCAVPAGQALYLHADLPYRDREAIARGIASLVA